MNSLLEKYKTDSKKITKTLMELSVAAKQSYEQICNLTPNERVILYEVLTEKAEAMNPKKQQQKMVPGQVNGPQTPQTPKSEQR
jgi:hypothetical protein|tara:strand:- start:227 stop:478 length:252 start_codon:yes stop_codon:yes gene_type:complete